jgi:uncharacterized protein (TIGR04255 family)
LEERVSVGRERYDNAPLALVVAEVRLGYEPLLKAEETLDRYASEIRSRFPALAREQTVRVQFGTSEKIEQLTLPQVRGTTLNSNTTIALNPNSLTMQMDGAEYRTYSESFGPLLEFALSALVALIPEVQVERIGLRYIDEVRPPETPADARAWSKWINPQLLAIMDARPDWRPVGVQAGTTFAISDAETLTFNSGLFRGATVVDQSLPFARKGTTQDWIFVLDVDSAWTPTEFTRLASSGAAELVDRLHEPASDIFEWAITDEARKFFKGEAS